MRQLVRIFGPPRVAAVALLLLAFAACKKSPPPDPLCSYQPVPQTTRLEPGQGALQVSGTTDAYFYLRDKAGKQVASGALNLAVGVKPGEYRALLHNSVHTVFVQEGMLTRCGCGSLQVVGSTDEYYYVLDPAGNQLASSKLGAAISLFPDTYRVKVNNTLASIQVAAGGTAELKTGLLQVPGTTDEYYYVLDSAGTQLLGAKLGRGSALLPGSWTVKVNNTTSKVDIRPGETTQAQAGTLKVNGSTNEYYYVLNDAGTQLANSQLRKTIALFPGAYQVRVNNSTAQVSVTAGSAVEVEAGTVTVKGAGTDYYYVLDANGTQLASAQVNQPTALVAGQYSVRVGKDTKPAVVTGGKETVVSW